LDGTYADSQILTSVQARRKVERNSKVCSQNDAGAVKV